MSIAPALRIADEDQVENDIDQCQVVLVNSRDEANALIGVGLNAWAYDDTPDIEGRDVIVLVSKNGYVQGEAPRIATFAKRNGANLVKLVAPMMDKGETFRQWLDRGRTVDELLAECELALEWKPNEPAKLDPASLLMVDDDPGDLDAIEIVDRWPRIEEEAFYGIAGEVVSRVEPHTEADRAALLVQFLVATANMLGRRAYCQVSATRHYSNMFVVLVGMTAAGRKGTSWDCIEHVLRMIDPQWADGCLISGVSSGEGILTVVRNERYEDRETKSRSGGVLRERVLVDAGISDKRALFLEPEFGRLLKVGNRDGSIVTDILRELWDKGSAGSASKNNPVKTTNAHVSVIAHTTQADLDKYLASCDAMNGTANRFLWCLSRRSKTLPEGGDLGSVDWTGIRRRLGRVRDFVGREPEIKMTRDSKAKKLWSEIYSEYSIERPGLFGAIVGRAAPQILRLSAVYAILDESAVIRPEHIVAANAMWNYAEASAKQVFEKGTGNPNAEKLLAELRTHPGGLSKTEVYRDVFGCNVKAPVLAKLLSDMLTQGVVHREKKPNPAGAGRPVERWFFGRAN